MSRTGLLRALAAIGLLGATTVGVSSSGATFTSSTSNPNNSVSAAADWVPPTVAVTTPGSYLRGNVSVGATASDSGSGVASIKLQYAQGQSSSSYGDLCSGVTSPLSCNFDSTQTPDGIYKLRATAVDKASNSATTDPTTVTVDNTAPAGSVAAPAGPFDDTVTLSASASDATSGVAKVSFQRARTGTSTWTEICADTSSPYTCAWDTTGVSDGSYDLRVVVTDAAGNSFTSATISRTVDNTAPTAYSMSTVNNGTAGRVEQGDQLVLRYSEVMDLSSLVSGWSSGTSPSFVLELRNRSQVSGSTGDLVSFTGASFGLVDLAATGYASSSTTVKFAATATATTVNGGTQVTITLGTRSGGSVGTVSSSVRPVWYPSAAATDLAGNATSTSSLTQASATKGF